MNFFNRLLDATILYSFDKNGFARHQKQFTPLKNNLAQKRYLITGANAGLGKATAFELAQRNAEVWMLCRNQQKAEESRREIIQQTKNTNIHILIVDISCLQSIKAAVKQFHPTTIDCLIHNAGVLPNSREETAQGFELCVATNVIGPFLLNHLLMPKMNPSGRIILVSSGGMYPVKLNLKQLETPPSPYNGVQAYAQTKRAQVILGELWAKQLAPIKVHTMHPGWADTDGVKTSIPKFYKKTKNILRSPEQGADTIVYLATEDDLQSGLFWFDRKPRKTHFLPWTRETNTTRDKLLEQLKSWTKIDQ